MIFVLLQQLCLVTLGLFSTIVKLHCEDAMIVLIFQYLIPCNHIMTSQISLLSQPYNNAPDKFLQLIPAVCQVNIILITGEGHN